MYFTFKKVNDNLVTIDARTDNGEVKAKSFTNPTRPVDLGTFALFALNLGEAMDADLVEPEQLVFCYEQSYENVISVLTNAEYFIVRAILFGNVKILFIFQYCNIKLTGGRFVSAAVFINILFTIGAAENMNKLFLFLILIIFQHKL